MKKAPGTLQGLFLFFYSEKGDGDTVVFVILQYSCIVTKSFFKLFI